MTNATLSKNLLVELFVEELPPKALKSLGEAFASTLADSLKSQGLLAADPLIAAFASPRRLAVHITGVAARAADKAVRIKLMPVSVAFDGAGEPTTALKKKLAAIGAAESALPGHESTPGRSPVDSSPSGGLARSDRFGGAHESTPGRSPVDSSPSGGLARSDRFGGALKREGQGKAETLFLDSVVTGVELADGLQTALDEAIARLPIPKVMQYQLDDGWTSVRFVRPAHGLLALHGADVVPVSALGLQAGRTTRGHRFEARVPTLTLNDADSYADALRKDGAVIASFAERRADIVRQLAAAAAAEGLTPVDDDALLDEVTALVERPNVLRCRFDEAFLDVPPQCLILTMKANQRYFPLLDADGRLSSRFLVVSNIRPDDPSAVIDGNERVVRPRLADAKFFFDQDRKRTLESRVAGLDKVVYHGRLGTQGERTERVRAIALEIASKIAVKTGSPALAAQADRAALLAKADLLTGMVGEFPELQGVMGAIYARHDGETEDVAVAIEDHYKPRFAGDELPRNQAGIVVALADKMETLAGLFGIGQVPSGDKDPFALRRHALGVVRMLVERGLALPVADLVAAAFAAFPAAHGQAQDDVARFIDERLVGYLRDRGYSAREVDAVVALRPAQWADLPTRLAAVRAFAALPEAEPLAAANKRVGNILRKSDEVPNGGPDASLLAEPAERALAQALAAAGAAADRAFGAGDYTASLQALAVLKAPVDAFFDHVMVNTDDPALRRNRLALLQSLHQAMNRVADLSRLAS